MKLTYATTICTAFFSNAILAEQQPNILLILADDAGYNDFGFQGSKEILTPNLDMIAKNGVRFTDAHVTATVCSPSRAGLITGRYQQRFGHEGNCPPAGKGMNVKEETMADTLRATGYRTALFGKWHLGDIPELHPNKRGFDTFYGMLGGGRNYFYSPKGSDRPGNHDAYLHNAKPTKFKGYFTDELGDRCMDFISEKSEKPFFAFLSFNAPHTPLHARKDDLETFKDSPRPKVTAMIWAMDRAIGSVIQKLKDNGQYDNTIIYFLSDNGGTPTNQGCNWPLNGWKGNEFEGGSRVPFLMQWPAKIKPGQVVDGMISSLDIHATSLAVAGGKFPKVRPLDGVNLIPYVTGKKTGAPHKVLFARKLNCAAMREANWKLIRVDNVIPALYNLTDDIGEKSNVAKQYPERVQNMLNKMDKWEQGLVEPWWGEGSWEIWTRNYHIELINNKGKSVERVKHMSLPGTRAITDKK